MNTVAVIDYGMGNLRSVARALEHVADGGRIVVTADRRVVHDADRVVLPGVGALRDCMTELDRLGLVDELQQALTGKPFLGICLGMQALLDDSEENGGTPGMGIIAGRALRFADPAGAAAGPGTHSIDHLLRERLKVPHMGWSPVDQTRAHPLWRGIPSGSRFYFVHSYYAVPAAADDTAATTDYGRRFASAIARDNIFAVQFHPEKSQHAGLTLLANFLQWNGSV